MYLWRSLTEDQRLEVIEYRRNQRYPKHSLPHFDRDGQCSYLLTAACYEHRHVVGKSPDRMSAFESDLLGILDEYCSKLYAWCLLPNHYHVLCRTPAMKEMRMHLGRLHGRTAYSWNKEDGQRGRIVWRNCFERPIETVGHHFATMNYVLNNAVHHGYARKWQDWPWSNATEYLEDVGDERASEVWRTFPVLDYGAKWDVY